jgi:hypothetical protein
MAGHLNIGVHFVQFLNGSGNWRSGIQMVTVFWTITAQLLWWSVKSMSVWGTVFNGMKNIWR